MGLLPIEQIEVLDVAGIEALAHAHELLAGSGWRASTWSLRLAAPSVLAGCWVLARESTFPAESAAASVLYCTHAPYARVFDFRHRKRHLDARAWITYVLADIRAGSIELGNGLQREPASIKGPAAR